jgi:hypothetical protein
MVDVDVTGSDKGTASKDPRFSLKSVFHDVVFHEINALMMAGGGMKGTLR